MFRIIDKISCNKRLGIIVMVMFLAIAPTMSLVMPMQTYHAAGSWIDNDSKDDIYGDDKGRELDENLGEDDAFSASDVIGDMFWGFVDLWTDMIYSVLDELGITLGSVTMGRLDGGGVDINGNRVALFTYEISDGNFYGIASMAIYNMIRTVVFVLIVCIVAAKYVSALYVTGASRALASLKESSNNLLVGFILLAMMPNLIDLAIYIRDLILYSMSSGVKDLFGVKTLNISKIMKTVSQKNHSLFNSMMYSASNVLVFYYAFSYTSVAMSMVIHVVAFPFVTLVMQFDKNALKNWVMGLLGYLAIPIIDFSLLLIPSIIGLVKDSMAITVVQFIVCCCILKGRQAFKQAVGIRGMQGEMQGVMMMMGIGKLATSMASVGAGAITAGAGGAASAAQSGAMGDMYGKMAQAESMVGFNKNVARGMPTSEGKHDSAFNLKNANVPQGSGVHEQASISGESNLEQAQNIKNGQNMRGGVDSGKRNMDSALSVQAQENNTVGSPENMKGFADNSTFSADSIGGIDANESNNFNDEDVLAKSRQAILESYATPDNVDEPMFRNISNSRKAELYNMRAKNQKKEATNRVLGRLAGGALGAGVGFASSMFLGPGAVAMATGAGLNMGGAAGDYLAKKREDVPGTYGYASPAPSVADGNEVEEIDGDVVEPVDNSSHANNATSAVRIPEAVDDASQFDNYRRAYFARNAQAVRSATESVFSVNNKAQSKSDLERIYRTNSSSYSSFRNAAGSYYESALKSSLDTSLQSCGNEKLDNTCKQELVEQFSATTINPKDDKGQQIELPPEHVLSRESLASMGFEFPM